MKRRSTPPGPWAIRTAAVAVVLAAASTGAHGQDTPAPAIDAQALFVTNCASCHGETGDGKGWTELDRPARSFQDGGFSFGNTPLALFRTISTGIPGTPMPAFASSLSEEERRALADYVVTLGPPVEEVGLDRAIMEVGERARVVRGFLPPVAEGAKELPRGLLLGLPSGFTFEYRADLVRLLAVRQGGFVERMDWTGRGGTALKPLGQVVHLVGDGVPGPAFRVEGVGTLEEKLAGTWVTGGTAGVVYRLVSEDGANQAVVRETPRVVGTKFGSGFTRLLEIRGAGQRVQLTLALPVGPGGTIASPFRSGGLSRISVNPLPGGLQEVVHVEVVHPGALFHGKQGHEDLTVILNPEVGAEARTLVAMTTMVFTDWNEEVQDEFARVMTR